MQLGIAGESLQKKLTSTSLMNRNHQRESSNPCPTFKDQDIDSWAAAPLLAPPNAGL